MIYFTVMLMGLQAQQRSPVASRPSLGFKAWHSCTISYNYSAGTATRILSHKTYAARSVSRSAPIIAVWTARSHKGTYRLPSVRAFDAYRAFVSPLPQLADVCLGLLTPSRCPQQKDNEYKGYFWNSKENSHQHGCRCHQLTTKE